MLILASASPRRRDILESLGLVFEVEPADIDETVGPGEAPRTYVERLALTKAGEVFFRNHGTQGANPAIYDPELMVIGADTIVVAPDGTLLGKPVDDADARRMLHALSGRTHHVLTGVAVLSRPAPGTGDAVVRNRVVVDDTAVTFRDLSDDDIDGYLATGEALDKAGAYGIQGAAGPFVDRIDGSFTNVVGLAVEVVTTLLGLR